MFCFLVGGGEFLTFKQIQEKKGTIKKGAKSELVVYYQNNVVETEEGEEKSIPLLRYYRVFHLDDVEGIETKIEPVLEEFNPIEKAEDVIKGYITCPKIIEDTDGAWYSPEKDIIGIPDKKQFKTEEKYYATLFHESIHSTGHKSRLDRFTKENNINVAFGSEKYSKEELTAEIGSAMLCCYCGIDNVIENSASYIESWLKPLKNDKNFIIQASSKAQKAYDYILGL